MRKLALNRETDITRSADDLRNVKEVASIKKKVDIYLIAISKLLALSDYSTQPG